jgi:hypothetical protein
MQSRQEGLAGHRFCLQPRHSMSTHDERSTTDSSRALTSEIWVLLIGQVLEGVQVGGFDHLATVPTSVSGSVPGHKQEPGAEKHDDHSRIQTEVDVQGGHVTWCPLRLEQLTVAVQRDLEELEANIPPGYGVADTVGGENGGVCKHTLRVSGDVP